MTNSEINTINAVATSVHALARDKGWYDNPETEDQFVERLCNNLHDEVSELHAAWREGRLRSACDKAEGMKKLGLPVLSCLAEELADIVIRAFDNARRLGVDIGMAIAVKHRYNKERPKRHGGKKS